VAANALRTVPGDKGSRDHFFCSHPHSGPAGAAIAASSGLTATATGASQVVLSWAAVGGADHYDVWRSSYGVAFASIGLPSGVEGTLIKAAHVQERGRSRPARISER
jgi:hypothetical protein